VVLAASSNTAWRMHIFASVHAAQRSMRRPSRGFTLQAATAAGWWA
jgi:hypothetical protein